MTMFKSNQGANATFIQNTNNESSHSKKLRVVTLNYLPSAYRLVTDWIAENNHEHILAVTSPGIKERATPSYQDMLPLIDRNVNTLVTSKMKTVLTPMLEQLKPDIILCFTFAHLIGSEICQIPTFGAVNIHPSVLPLYRGPNPMRQFYDGAEMFGATAHRMANGYDTGEILSQEYEKLPEIVTQDTAVRWGQLIKKSITNGMERAISGKAGFVQDDTKATYAAPFSEEEKWIDLNEPSKVILRKTLALNLTGGLAKTVINGRIYKIYSADYVPYFTNKPVGSIIKHDNGIFEVIKVDGSVKLVTEVFDADKKYSNVLPCSAFFGQNINAKPLNLSSYAK
jgi:methionyl-tRNA formyltransferase